LKKYSVAIIDPPWVYSRNYGGDPKNGGLQYPTMSMSDIANLGVYLNDIMEKDSYLFVWMTGPKIPEQVSVVEKWSLFGFKWITFAFTWLKKYKSGNIYSGLGSHTKSNQEYVALLRRGKCLPRLDKTVLQVIESVPGKHSEKPIELHKRIENLYGTNLNKIELFARKRQPGWDCLGNEISGLDICDELQEIIDGVWSQR
jgi:site-specific DNA-methyltransferase (adenine-specific)